MPFDPTKSVDRQSLFNAVKHANRHLRSFRQKRLETLREYVGKHYSEHGSSEEKLVALLSQAAEIYSVKLASNNPRVLVTARNATLADFAPRFQLALNNYIAEIHLNEVLQACVIDAFFCLGIAKIFLDDAGALEVEPDVWIDPGKPFVKSVSIDDFVFDTTVSKWSKCSYYGDVYRVDYERVEEGVELGLYDKKVAKEIAPLSNGDASSSESERADQITTGRTAESDSEFKKRINLVDFYFPREGIICTWAVSQRSEEWDILSTDPLHQYEWNGPECGPYLKLGFGDVPDNIMALAPSMLLRGLDGLANNIYRKMSRQTQRQKTILAVGSEGEADGKRIRQAADGEIVRVTNPQQLNEMKFGGVDSNNAQMFASTVQLFDRMGGNLQTAGGLGATTATVGQEEIVKQGNSELMARKQERFALFTEEIVTSLAHLVFYDPVLEVPGRFEVPGTNIAVESNWTPEMREGDFIDFNLRIEPYSMGYRSPAQRAEQIMAYVQQVAIPLMPEFQAQGGVIDLTSLTAIYADLYDIPRLKEVIRFSGIPMQDPSMAQEPGKPANTTRTNIRQNVRSGATAGAGLAETLHNFQGDE